MRTAFRSTSKPSTSLKAGNAEQRYLSGLSDKIRAVEKQSIAAELETALFVSSASMVLKLGIASVALTGAVLLVQGSIDVLTLFLFLMASRMYDPMQGALQNLAAVIAMRTNVGRMNEILDAPLQTGGEQLTNRGCDIVFDHVGFAPCSSETVPGLSPLPPSRARSRHWWFLRRQQDLFPDWQHGSGTTRRAASPWAAWRFPESTREKLMSLYSIVFQDVTLFDNTILEKHSSGAQRARPTRRVTAAAKAGKLRGICRKLPDKWNTNIGENGCALSGGERQRISIARAFLKDTPIILLDEATASLDRETKLRRSGHFPGSHKTQNCPYHRPPDAQRCGQIVVLSGGIVVEQGSPANCTPREDCTPTRWICRPKASAGPSDPIQKCKPRGTTKGHLFKGAGCPF